MRSFELHLDLCHSLQYARTLVLTCARRLSSIDGRNRGQRRDARRLDWRTTRRDGPGCVNRLRDAWKAKLGLDSSAAYVAEVKTVVIIVRDQGSRRWLNVERLVDAVVNNSVFPAKVVR